MERGDITFRDTLSQPLWYQSPVSATPLTLNATMVGNNREDDSSLTIVPSASSAQSSPHPMSISGAQALQPSFQPPPPGQLLVAQATLTMGGYKRSLPVLYYTSFTGDHKYVYPFTRSLIGTVWHTPEHLNRCEFQYIPETDPMRFCTRRVDLPSEMVHRLLISLEQNGGGPNLDLQKLHQWHEDIRNPHGKFFAGIPCMQCGLLNEVRLCDVMHLTSISNGIVCSQFGRECMKDDPQLLADLNATTNPVPPISNHLVDSSSLSCPAPVPVISTPIQAQPINTLTSPWMPPSNTPSLGMPPTNNMQTNLLTSFMPGHTTPNPSIFNTDMQFNGQHPMHPTTNIPVRSPPQHTPTLMDTVPSIWQRMEQWDQNTGPPHDSFPSNTRFPQNPSNTQCRLPFQNMTRQNTKIGDYNFGVNPTPDPSNVLLCDEIIQPGEKLHEDPDTRFSSYPQGFGDDAHVPHPSMLVRGRVLHSFTTPPPSLDERRELQQIKTDNRLERLNTALSKKLSDRTIPTFKGNGDDVQSYSQWEAALLKHFYASGVNNSATRAWLAQNTFADAANVWWVSHQCRRPRLTLSWMQLRELIQAELVPSVERGSANAAWADLTFDGGIDSFFSKVRNMSLYHPLPPKELQIMASRPFGAAFVERVRGTSAQHGMHGLTIPQWEAMVRAYVREQEAHPQFQAWGKGGLEPIHKSSHRLRHAVVNHDTIQSDDDDDEITWPSDIPKGMDEEEWTMHVSHLFSTLAQKPSQGKALKIGKGPRPCFVCGQEGHSWVRCSKRQRGKCGVCGSLNHFTRFCANRYYPDPKLFSLGESNKKPPTPTANMSNTSTTIDPTPHSCDQSVNQVVAPSPSSTDYVSAPDPDVTPWPSIRQVKIDQAGDLALPPWLKHRLSDNGSRIRVGNAIIPMDNPATTGQLHFKVTVEGAQATMLYDPGASHCFMDWGWANKHQIRVKPRPSSSLNMFQGTALGAIKWSYIANDFVLGDASYVWRFLVIKPAPADIVLGLDFILHHKPLFDPLTLRLWPTSPAPQPKEAPKEDLTSHEPHQDGVEDHWITTCDAIQPRHLNFAKVVTFDAYTPYSRDAHSTTMLSVTADSMEEEKALQVFYDSLDSELLKVVRSFDAVFAPPDREPPNRPVKHVIDLNKDALPIKRRPYPLPPHKLDAMKTQICELDRNGWIEPSTSPWGAPILFVPKKSGEWRMCVDFRDLNSMTIDDSFPLPRIEVMLHRASHAKIFSKLDLASGFHQIEVSQESRPLTAFRLPEPVNGSSLWQWKVMPFGLRNAPPTFQRAMSQALDGLQFCSVVYIDDILIFSDSKEDHLKHLGLIFTALHKHQYHIRLPKCEFLREEVEFLGHQLSKEGISTQPQKITALQGWKTPLHTTKQVKSFLGAAAWYQNYIPHFATLAAPLYALTSTRKKFMWTDDCENAVDSIKQALLCAPVLARWEQHRETRIITDASKVGVGAVLEQKHDCGWRPITYWSRKLRDAELNYSATDLEWLAVVMSVTKMWHWLLEGKPFIICSDHKALERKLHKSAHDPPISDRQARWIESLIKFPYTFQWIKGINNTFADALSRNPTPACRSTISVTHALLAGLRKRLKIVAERDLEYQALLKQADDPTSDLKTWQGLVIDAQGRVCVPKDDEIRTLLISEVHDSPMAGHFGMDRTLELLQRQWYWKGIQSDVREYVKSCVTCQRAKHSTSKTPGELHPIVAKHPWEIVTMDFVTGLPLDSRTKFSQILVMVDKFTKYVMLEPCGVDVDAKQTAALFTKRVISEHGVPSIVISDRGPQFSSEVWATILKLMGSRTAIATTHHPQTDGQSERVIQTLTRIIRAYVRDQSSTWLEMLPLFQFALNNSASSATHLSPFQLAHGRDPVSPVNFMLNQPDDLPGGVDLGRSRHVISWARNWWKARRKLCKFALENLRFGAKITKRRYDSGRKPLHIEPGDLVLLSVKSHPAFGDVRKLRMRYTGPYVVKRKIHPNAYELEGLPPNVPPTQNVSHLRLFYPTPPKFETRPEPARAVGPLPVRSHQEWEVEAITQDRLVNGQRQYRLKWKDHEEQTWVRISQLQHCAEMLREYQHEHGIALDYWDDSSSSPETQSDAKEQTEDDNFEKSPTNPEAFNWKDDEPKDSTPRS